MKIQVNFVITSKGEVAMDVIGAKGHVCMTILEQLEELLGEASHTKVKPEYELDEEVIAILRDQGVQL